MPSCAFHPDVETSLRCAECDRYICPRDMVATPVGYKCRECARPAAGQLRGASTRQLVEEREEEISPGDAPLQQ